MPELIVMPEIKTWTRKAAEAALTAGMWCVCLYFFVPVIDASLHFEGDTYVLEGLKRNLTRIGVTLAVSFALFSAWRYYNYFRFGKNDRRRAGYPVTPERVAVLFDMTQAEIFNLRESKEAASENHEHRKGRPADAAAEGLLVLSYLEDFRGTGLSGGERVV